MTIEKIHSLELTTPFKPKMSNGCLFDVGEMKNPDLQLDAFNVRQSHSICLFCPPKHRYRTNIMRNMMVHVFTVHPNFRHEGPNRLPKDTEFAKSELEILCLEKRELMNEEQELQSQSPEEENKNDEDPIQADPDPSQDDEEIDIYEVLRFCNTIRGPLNLLRASAIIEHFEVDSLAGAQSLKEFFSLSPGMAYSETYDYPSGDLARVLHEDIQNRQCMVHLVKLLNRRPAKIHPF